MKHFKIILLFFLFFGCSDEPAPQAPPSFDYFVEATSGKVYSKTSLQLSAAVAGLNEFQDIIQYGIKTYKLTYKTSYKNETIEASGLLFVPQEYPGEAPLLSLQHGTTFLKDQAPSVTSGITGVEFFAATGYIGIMPDFIGYGSSSDKFHPYYDYNHSAYAVIDMIKAAKEFLTEEEIKFNDKLFLTGYSEGGYVTLAAAKEIELNVSDLTVTAVAAGAGGYHLENMFDHILNTTEYGDPSYIAFVVMAYNITNDWNKPLSYFFTNVYAEALSEYMDGEHSGGFIDSKLTDNIEELFNADFYSGIKNSEEEEFKDALIANSVAGWDSEIPIRLYHGDTDEVIPYENSQVTLTNFVQQGSSTVSLWKIEGGNHGNSFTPMIKHFVPWFEQLR